MVAVDPLNPLKIVSVWVNDDTPDITFTPFTQVFVEGDYSVNGGQRLDALLHHFQQRRHRTWLD